MNANFGERIKKLRTDKKMSQAALAEALHISRQAVQRWEDNINFPNNELLLQIVDFFEVSTDYLYGREQKTEPKSEYWVAARSADSAFIKTMKELEPDLDETDKKYIEKHAKQILKRKYEEKIKKLNDKDS